ncbi:MAG: alpha-hydroxy acid oxidase [Ferrimicrobium sp.]
MPTRQMPRWSRIAPMIQPRRASLDRLERAQTIGDLRTLARKRAPRAVFDYTDGAADDEVSIARSRSAFASVEFSPRVLRDVSRVDTTTSILGSKSALPFCLAPTGFTRMMHTEGEPAVARVAARAQIPYALSTMGTTSVSALADAAPDLRRWFQLYLWRDRAASEQFIAQAQEFGYEALVLTVDVPVAGNRLRDARNGLTIPLGLSPRTMAEAALHPAWWLDLFTTEPIEFASINSFGGTAGQLINQMFDPTATLADIEWIRQRWRGPLVVKGIQAPDDARRVVDAGVEAIVVSNHGGRQLDRSPTPLRMLPHIAEAVGDHAEIFLDGGILNGADIVVGICLGATACLVGRAYLYGLMAGGERGVARAVDILSTEIERTMQLLGVTSIADLGPDYARLAPLTGADAL